MRVLLGRLIVATAAVLCALVGTIGRANATSELCPARVADWHGYAPQANGATYGFVLQSVSEQAARGQIVVATNVGYFTFAFPETAFVLDRGKYQTQQTTFERDRYLTAPLYVHFPASVTDVSTWWVTVAQTTGEKTFGWDAVGAIGCPLAPLDQTPAPHSPPNTDPSGLEWRLNAAPYDISAVPSSLGVIIAATPTVAPGDVDCAKPFAQAATIKAVPPDIPAADMQADLNGRDGLTTQVEVFVDATGKVADTAVFQPSGSANFDAAVQVAAVKSTYSPAVSFCKAVPARYLFRGTLTSNQ